MEEDTAEQKKQRHIAANTFPDEGKGRLPGDNVAAGLPSVEYAFRMLYFGQLIGERQWNCFQKTDPVLALKPFLIGSWQWNRRNFVFVWAKFFGTPFARLGEFRGGLAHILE